MLTVYFAWPVVLALAQLAAVERRDRLRFAGLYLAVLILALGLGLLRSTNPDPLGLIVLWLNFNAEATVLLMAFLTPRVRAVGPLVLAFMTAGVAGTAALPQLVTSSEPITKALLRAFMAGGLGGRELYYFLHLAGFVILAVAGWGLLRLIGRRYRLKRMSDQSLTLDAMWLLFAVDDAILLASGDWIWMLSGVAAFVLYKLVLRVAFARFVRPAAAGAHSPTLLLLRVFSLGARSLRLFDVLTKYWLRAGPIMLIAGPDLVTGTVEPPEFLDFVGGRVSRQFVQGRDDLEQRLTQLDTRPDPDGRYRANEFFCRADTWQMTMRELAARSDAVLMDLRSFSASNQGCRYELGQLLGGVLLTRVVIVIDKTTDRVFLEDTLHGLWQAVPADSPNRALPNPEVGLFEIQSGTGAEVRALLGLLW